MIGLGHEINSLQKDLEIMMQRKKNIHLVVDQVSGWTNKVMNKLNTQLGMPTGVTPKHKPMSETFNRITGIVCDELNNIIEENRHRKEILDQK